MKSEDSKYNESANLNNILDIHLFQDWLLCVLASQQPMWVVGCAIGHSVLLRQRLIDESAAGLLTKLDHSSAGE